MTAFACFDMDLYGPSKKTLQLVRPHMVRRILDFDELLHAQFPGEKVALKELNGLEDFKIERLPFTSHESFAVVP